MTWFFRTAAFCATLLLLGFTLEVLGYTLYMCQRDCKGEPDEPVCSRWNFTADDPARTKHSDYVWLKNECERKCFQRGSYERVADMELCTKHGQTRLTYICSDYYNPDDFDLCMKNKTISKKP